MTEGLPAAEKNNNNWLVMCLLLVTGSVMTLIAVALYDNRKIDGKLASSTPYKSFNNFIESFQLGIDKVAYDYCSATKTEREIISLYLAIERVAEEFRQDLITAYGDDAWGIFNDLDNGPSEGNCFIPLLGKTIIDKSAIVFDGDQASYIVHDNLTLKSVKTSKGWLIDASCLIPEGANTDACLRFFQPMPLIIKKYQKAIGYPGIGLVDIDAELGRELLAPIFSLDMPHRFDIDAIIAEVNSSGVKQEQSSFSSDEIDRQNKAKSEIILDDNSVKIKNIEVGGIRLVKFEDEENGVRPFNWNKGYTLSVVAELSKNIFDIDSGYVNKAITDTGLNIIRDPRISFPNLSHDGKIVIFEVGLLVPNKDVSNLKEISGELDYSISTGQKIVELGIDKFKTGVHGDRYNSKILRIEKSTEEWRKGETDLEFQMDQSDHFGSITFFDDEGNELEVESRGWSSDGQTITFEFTIEGDFPDAGDIKIVVYEGVKSQKLPFKLSDISLLGNPKQ